MSARVACCVAVLAGCGSPDTCDLHTAADLSTICNHLFESVYGGSRIDLAAPFSCAGGGSGTLNIHGSEIWGGTFTFDGCTTTVAADTLTLTGTITFNADENNNVFAGKAYTLAISGDVDGCQSLHETCNGSWSPDGYPYGGYARTQGTLCGRDFP